MNRSLTLFSGRLVLMGLLWTFCFAGLLPGQRQQSWIKLGDRTVNYTVDHNEMIIDGIQKNLTGLRVKVKKGAINLHRCAIFYSNGQTLDVDILNSIPQGGESKLLELPAGNPVVTKVVFTYDTKNRAIQKAEVECWGRTN